jgi:RNA polymerase sigma-70 factor (ECF subfamily)
LKALPNNVVPHLARFEGIILPHLAAAYNLARWLTRRDQDAEDVVQEACLRAYQFFGGFHGGDGRTWLLTIVKNTCYTWLKKNRRPGPTTPFDEEKHGPAPAADAPESLLFREDDRQLLRDTLGKLPAEYREVIVLRDLEGMSYKEIAQVAGVPLGTVMSRLARGRERLRQFLLRRPKKEPGRGPTATCPGKPARPYGTPRASPC